MGRTLVTLEGTGAVRSRLICFHHAGGGASAYLSWRRLLPSDIDLCLVQLPGREERFLDRPHSLLGDAIDDVATAIAGLSPLPSLFFGHSMGAVIAFEVARRLGGRGPRQLVLSASQPPHILHLRAPISHLEDAPFVLALQNRTNGLPAEILADRDMLSLYVSLLKADFGAVERHVAEPGEPVAVPIVAVGGESDPAVEPAALAEWARQTRGSFDLHLFPGDHFYFSRDPAPLLSLILARMAREGLTGVEGVA